MAVGKHDYVNDITPTKESWDIVVRVVRSWFLLDMNSKQNFYAMELVFMDEKVILIILIPYFFIIFYDYNYYKGVVADSKRSFCPKCNKHIWTIVPR